MEDDFDTDAAGILIGDDTCDVATAMAASYRPQPASRSAGTNRRYFDFGLIAGPVVCIAWLLWQ